MNNPDPLSEPFADDAPPPVSAENPPDLPETPVEEDGDKPAVDIAAEAETPPETEQSKYENMKIAMKEERGKRQSMETQLQEMTANFNELKGPLDAYRKDKQAEEEQSKHAAEVQATQQYEANPAEYLKERQEEITQRLDSATEQKEQQDEYVRISAAIGTQVDQHRETDPDYINKMEFAKEHRMKEYAALGYPKEQHEQAFQNECFQLGLSALQQGVNPGQMVSNLVTSWGYKPGEAASGETSDQKVERLAAGAQAAQSLTGGAAEESSALKAIEKMSDAEFDKHWDDEVVPKRH